MALCRYKRPEDARMALEQMEGFELAGRTVGSSFPHQVSIKLMVRSFA